MRLQKKIKYTGIGLFVLLIINDVVLGQRASFNYQREIQGITDEWHKIELPDDIFSKISHDFRDIRIIGITPSHDTVEAPYLLKVTKDKNSIRDIPFTIINSSRKGNLHFVTFEVPSSETINHIDLSFEQQNFDWKVKLEGSQNLNSWVTMAENYRILSIKNDGTDFSFTRINFPPSKYKYLQLSFESVEKPVLEQALLSLDTAMDAQYKVYKNNKVKVSEDPKTKTTEVYVDLIQKVPVSGIEVFVNSKKDYYRPISIAYVSDSIQLPSGWSYQYTNLYHGTLHSLSESSFYFNSTILNKLKINISNNDNQPLKIDSIKVKGYLHEVFIRFDEKASYYLVYGNEKASQPIYDLTHFTNTMPKTISTLHLGAEIVKLRETKEITLPLFKSKLWLWIVMISIILVLGLFALKMIHEK